MAPPEKKNGKYPFVLYNLGGILVCGILSLIPLVFSAVLAPSHPLLGMCLFLFGFIAFVMNLFNAIPTNGKIANDATNLRMAIGNPRAQDAFWNQLQYCALQAQNIRTADMPEELFFMPEKTELGNPLLVWQALACIGRAEERGDYEQARKNVYFVLIHAPVLAPMTEGLLQSEAVFLDSLLGYDPSHIDAFYAKLKKIKFIQNTLSFQKASYAYFALCKKDSEQAAKARETLQKAIQKIPFPTDLAFEQSQLERIENILSANSGKRNFESNTEESL